LEESALKGKGSVAGAAPRSALRPTRGWQEAVAVRAVLAGMLIPMVGQRALGVLDFPSHRSMQRGRCNGLQVAVAVPYPMVLPTLSVPAVSVAVAREGLGRFPAETAHPGRVAVAVAPDVREPAAQAAPAS